MNADTAPTLSQLKYDEIERILRGPGFVVVAEHPALRHQLHHLQRSGRLVAACPGHLILADRTRDTDLRIRVAAAWLPDGVLMGHAAARVSFDPGHEVPVIEMVTNRKRRAPDGIRLIRWEIPEEHVAVHRGFRYTRPALTAIDLSRHDDGATIDMVLRLGAATLEHLRRALRDTPQRLGNPARRFMIDDSRDEPWSPAERRAHRLLREAGITGWSSNLRVSLDLGRHGFVDIAFDGLKLCIEIDGYGYHGQEENREQFEKDRFKWSCLEAGEWHILHFTWRQLVDDPEWVISIVLRTRRNVQRSHLTLAA